MRKGIIAVDQNAFTGVDIARIESEGYIVVTRRQPASQFGEQISVVTWPVETYSNESFPTQTGEKESK